MLTAQRHSGRGHRELLRARRSIRGVIEADYAQTVSAVLSFFLAVTVWPEIARKAQEEIDRVIGRSRLPTFDDRADLPYVDSLVWECIRWNPGT